MSLINQLEPTMVYFNSVIGGFLFSIGFFIATVLVKALFGMGICS